MPCLLLTLWVGPVGFVAFAVVARLSRPRVTVVS